MSEVQFNVRVPPAIKDTLDDMARSRGLSRAVLIRQMVGLFQIVEDARQKGHWVGVTSNRDALDVVVPPL